MKTIACLTITALLVSCANESYETATIIKETTKEVRVEVLVDEETSETVEANEVTVEIYQGVNGSEVKYKSIGGAGQFVFNNPARNGNKGILSFLKYDQLLVSYFTSLSFEYRINSGSSMPYVNFQVDLNCDGFDLDQNDYILAKAATTVSTNFTAFSVTKATVMDKYPVAGTATLASTPNACFSNAHTLDGGMPLNRMTGGIMVNVGDSTITTPFNVDIRNIIVDLKELQ